MGGYWLINSNLYFTLLRFDVLVVREGGGVLQIALLWGERHDAGGSTVVHHIQCGGGRSGPPLGIIGGGKSLG